MPVSETASTVLIVEDETLVRMYGSDLLEEAGFAVLEASDADEALAILDRQEGVSLVFSDVDMPGSMDGLDLARTVHSRWPHIRLLLTSGHHRLDDSHVPANGQFVRKPWGQGVLVARVKDLLHA